MKMLLMKAWFYSKHLLQMAKAMRPASRMEALALSRITLNMILKPNKSSQLSTQLINVELAMVKLLFPMGKAN